MQDILSDLLAFILNDCQSIMTHLYCKKRVFATYPHFLIPIFLQPDDVNIRYFKLKLFDLPGFIF